MYAKAHPIGYAPIKNKQSSNLSRFAHSQEPVQRVQTIRMRVPIEQNVRDEDGNVIYEGRGKNRKPVTEVVGYHEQTRVIKHYDPKPKRGRTLAEMVYESFDAHNK